MRLAEVYGCESIAFPCISTGVYRFPKEKAAQLAITAVKQIAPTLKSVKEITFVCFGNEDKKIYDKLLND